MRRRVAVVLTQVTCVLTWLPVAQAQPETTYRYLTLRGPATGWVDVRLSGKVSFDPARSVYQPTGKVAGFYVRPVPAPQGDESASAIGVAVKGFPSPAALGVVRTTLPAATYRFYLIADRQATVKIALTGLSRDTSVTVTRRAALSVAVGEVETAPDPVVRYAGHRSTVLRGGNRIAVTGIVKRLSPQGTPVPLTWGEVYSCIEPMASSGCPSSEEPTEGLVPNDTYDESGEWQLVDPGDLAGPARVHQHYAGTARPAQVLAAVVELTLVR